MEDFFSHFSQSRIVKVKSGQSVKYLNGYFLVNGQGKKSIEGRADGGEQLIEAPKLAVSLKTEIISFTATAHSELLVFDDLQLKEIVLNHKQRLTGSFNFIKSEEPTSEKKIEKNSFQEIDRNELKEPLLNSHSQKQ